ncbi:MAG: molybdopterin-binding protein [Actinomycetota bacterium]
MSETMKVAELATELLALAKPLAAFDMPLLDAHGATLALDISSGERVVMKAGSRIRSTQIALAASLGLDHLPTRPQPRVVVISAGSDLVEPGSQLRDGEDEFETNSWLLTTAVKEAGAVGYRVHTIPETAERLKDVVEDQLVRADLVVICGESHDESFDLIHSVLTQLGQVREVMPLIEGTGRHAFGTIGPDQTPVVALPGDPIFAYISNELFIRPMIRNMMGLYDIHRPVIKATLTNEVLSESGRHSFVRGILSTEKPERRLITALENQSDLVGLSDATGLIVIPEGATGARAGEEVDVLVLERRFN